MKMYDYYIIHSRSLDEHATNYAEFIENQGLTVFLPCRDLDEDGLPLEVTQRRINAIAESHSAVMIWDGVSQHSLIDLGACLALGVMIETVTMVQTRQVGALVNQLKARGKQ